MSPHTPAPAAPAEAPALPQAPATLSGLQAQAIDLRIQLAGLKAQWDGLRTQLDNMLQTNPARPGVQQKWADVGVEMAQVRGDLARVEAQIAQRTGALPGGTRAPNAPRGRRFDPSIGIPIGGLLLMMMVVPVSLAWARRIARGGNKPVTLSRDAIDRLERLEQAIDTVAIEVERISEGQRFVTKILADRPKRTDAEKVQQQGAPAEQPIRALGAGPAEPIQVAEREQVRERAKPE
jgi:hypothetical protein